jgi:hypothetical protein
LYLLNIGGQTPAPCHAGIVTGGSHTGVTRSGLGSATWHNRAGSGRRRPALQRVPVGGVAPRISRVLARPGQACQRGQPAGRAAARRAGRGRASHAVRGLVNALRYGKSNIGGAFTGPLVAPGLVLRKAREHRSGRPWACSWRGSRRGKDVTVHVSFFPRLVPHLRTPCSRRHAALLLPVL